MHWLSSRWALVRASTSWVYSGLGVGVRPSLMSFSAWASSWNSGTWPLARRALAEL